VLGTLRIAGEALTFECNSRQRLGRGKKTARRFGRPGAEIRKGRVPSAQDLLREMKDNPPVRKSSGIPPEVEKELMGEIMQKHYAAVARHENCRRSAVRLPARRLKPRKEGPRSPNS